MGRPTHQTLDGKTYLQMQYFTPIKWPTETNGSAVDLCEFHPWNSYHFLAGSLLSNSMVTWSYSMSCYGFIYDEQIVGNPSSSWKKYKGFGPSEKNILDLPTSGVLYRISDSELMKCFFQSFVLPNWKKPSKTKTAKMQDIPYISEELMYIHEWTSTSLLCCKKELHRIPVSMYSGQYRYVSINVYI